MVQWVYEAAVRSNAATDILVATPDSEIIEAVEAFGGKAALTSIHHRSGTDRLAELAEFHPADIYINVQGDEPLISPADIQAVAELLIQYPNADMSTLKIRCEPEELNDSSVVKVVTSRTGRALYFSRHPIPFMRDRTNAVHFRHLGIYGYRKPVLQRFATLEPTPLEVSESLEQLRLLENDFWVQVGDGHGSPVSVDTPEQAIIAEKWLRASLTQER